jgi:hypothetical protein
MFATSTTHILSPRLLSQMTSYDMGSHAVRPIARRVIGTHCKPLFTALNNIPQHLRGPLAAMSCGPAQLHHRLSN